MADQERDDFPKIPDTGWNLAAAKSQFIIKRMDGEPLTRRIIQFDLLEAIFNDKTACFMDGTAPTAPKISFGELYRKTLMNSNKMTGSQRAKMEHTPDFGIVMAQVCMLVNVGRINTTLAFYPDMRTALRTYHSIPSLQRNEGTRQHMYDAARMKTVLKGCTVKETPPIATLRDLINRQAAGHRPSTNPVVALFTFASRSTTLSAEHLQQCEFLDLFLPINVAASDRARVFLWLMYRYLEDSKGPNPFDPPPHNEKPQGKLAPKLRRTSKEECDAENVDTKEEIEFGKKMLAYRTEFLTKADTEFAQEQISKAQLAGQVPSSSGAGVGPASGVVETPPRPSFKGPRGVRKKTAITRALRESDMAASGGSQALDGVSSRASSVPWDGPTLHGAGSKQMDTKPLPVASSVIAPHNLLLVELERSARENISAPSHVSLVNHAMNHMTTGVIESDGEDEELFMRYVLERRIAVLQTFCNYPPVEKRRK